jgi:DNA-binding response OmpR family regulator
MDPLMSAEAQVSDEKSISVLVVDSHAAELASTVALLQAAGYQVSRALGFEEGRRSLDSLRPKILITSVRLGPYNGLHLIVRSRALSPGTSAILTHNVFDPVLELDARKEDAAFLVRPCKPQAFLDAVRASIRPASQNVLATGNPQS